MKKLIALLLAVVCIFSLCACDGKEEQEEQEKEVSLDLPALAQQISEEIGVIMPLVAANKALNEYGLSDEDCDEIYAYADVDFNKCNELWLVKAKDEATLENVKTYAQNHVDQLLLQQTYNAEVFAAAENAKMETRGLYFMLCVTTAGDAASVVDIFNNA